VSGRYPHLADSLALGVMPECPSCKAAKLTRQDNAAGELLALICPRCGGAFGPDGEVIRWRRPGLHHAR
jgi:hypothetical protein